ncbi:hypothetical protein [Agromyces sp. NPDC058064]|uniref:hypothetical protein n=1 Tax=Agromyces sp. NPDC058064 TaxID=3346322 RepID=UPI0036DF3CAD
MTEVVTIAGWNPWPLVLPLLMLAGGAAVIVMGVRRKRPRVIELGVFVGVAAMVAGALMTWGLSGVWDSDEQQRALAELGYTETDITTMHDERSGDRPVLEFTGVLDGQHGERGRLRHLSGEQWEVVEF